MLTINNKIIFIAIVCFVLTGVQKAWGNIKSEQPNEWRKLDQESDISKPFSSEIPSAKGLSNLSRSNEWGGGEDSPDPTDPSTGGAVPVGEGVYIMMFCIFVYYFFIKRKKQ